MRLGDLDYMLEKWENDPSQCGYDPNFYAVKALIKNTPTIDPETLPIVKQLRAENKKLTEALGDSFAIDLMNKLEKAERERDAAINDLRECSIEDYAECIYCSHRSKDTMYPNCINGSNWEWRGSKDENNS